MPGIALPVVALASSLVFAVPAGQEGTPAPLPAMPEPAECLVEPRPAEFFVAVFEETLASPPAELPFDPEDGASETFNPPPIALPAGEGRPADAETVAAVTATVREMAACINAGDVPRFAALYTDEAARESFAFLASSIVAIRERNNGFRATPVAALVAELTEGLLQTAEPIPVEFRASVVAVRDVRSFPDGRVVAEVVGFTQDNGEVSGPALFTEERGRWRFAGTVAMDDHGTPVAATPAP